jgi:hypothetical protein
MCKENKIVVTRVVDSFKRHLKRMKSQRGLTEREAQILLFLIGLLVIGVGLADTLYAQGGRGTNYNPERINNAVNAVMTYLEGSFGALVMAAAGIGAIVSAAFGQYRACLSLMVVSIGAFILRSIMDTFFNTTGIQR